MVDLDLLQAGNVWKYIGMEIIRNAEGQPGVHVRNSESLKQIYGSVHGGIIATAVDAAVAVAVNSAIGKDYGAATVELKVNFLYPVVDSDIFAFARLVKEGNLMVGTAEVFDNQGQLVAIGTATYKVRPLQASNGNK
ncbi:PaaI family thioesterase [Desulfofundulus thermocisternus]|jgi:acyl-CoA thioesterase|uniref:PaaI family thioesterase n=1 Tax=Desulfofundulus thermocisternus TaxID=42471 RepID=UPI00048581C8|nr:PaaI family thioesterase [Desulfofundulus thermocisternus]